VGAQREEVGYAPGTVLLDRYRIVRELGLGGMSQVVLAEHLGLHRMVAMKFLLPELATLPDAPQRFVREATAATRVKSDHVARIDDQGLLPDGTPYMVMEYLEGEDLARMIRAGKRFPVQEAVDLVVQAADALSRAHAVGVIHRDVKPSNLFLTRRPDDTPLLKVLDFGISKVVEEAAKEDLQLTKTSVVMGSALYMSLEQMRSTRTVDHRTDIYALGISFYEMLTGSHPFTAETISELCVKVSLDPPIPLRSLRPDVPEALAEVLEIAYARNAAERYQTVGSFAAALLPFAGPDTARRIEAIQRFERGSYPDGKVPERQTPTPIDPRATTTTTPPRPFWVAYAVVAGAGLGAAFALWLVLAPDPHRGTGAGTTTTTTDATTTGTTTTSTADIVITVDAGPGDAGADGGKAKPPTRPCRPGEMVRMPNGLLKPCGL
jgi:serine/threonine-protein kinase